MWDIIKEKWNEYARTCGERSSHKLCLEHIYIQMTFTGGLFGLTFFNKPDCRIFQISEKTVLRYVYMSVVMYELWKRKTVQSLYYVNLKKCISLTWFLLIVHGIYLKKQKLADLHSTICRTFTLVSSVTSLLHSEILRAQFIAEVHVCVWFIIAPQWLSLKYFLRLLFCWNHFHLSIKLMLSP